MDLHTYTDAILYMIYDYYMNSSLQMKADFTDITNENTILLLDHINREAQRCKAQKICGWSSLRNKK